MDDAVPKKGRLYEAWYPVVQLQPQACDPQYWISQYCSITANYVGQSLFCSLKGKTERKPLKSNTIDALTMAWLSSQGVVEYFAQSTRGAAATAFIYKGISPAIVQATRDWECTDTFNKYYNRIRAMGAHQQCFVPLPLPETLPEPEPPSDSPPSRCSSVDSPPDRCSSVDSSEGEAVQSQSASLGTARQILPVQKVHLPAFYIHILVQCSACRASSKSLE